MKKLSSSKVAEVLAQVGPTLRAQRAENEVLKEKVAAYERRDRAEKIASVMEEKNLDTGTSRKEKVEALMGRKDLDVVEQAVEMSAPQMKLAALSDIPGTAIDAETAFFQGLQDE